MITNNRQFSPWILLVSIAFSALLTAYVYFFFVQTPTLSRREPLIALLVFLALTAVCYLLLSRFLRPLLLGYSSKGRVAWLLLSALIGFFAIVITPKVPYFILTLPKNSIQINIPPGGPQRTVTLQWFTTSLGDISFNQLHQEGDWKRTDTELVYSGSSPAMLRWSGRTGNSLQILFTGNPTAGSASISTNGVSQELDITSPTGTPVKFELQLAVSPINHFLVLFSLWFSVSFVFLALTLFLVHVPLKAGGKIRNQFEKVDRFLCPVSGLFFPKTGMGWWQGRDWIVITFFFLTACLFFLGRWNGLRPFVDLKSDAAYVTAYAASLDHPELFKTDGLFNNPGNFGYYSSMQVSLIRGLRIISGEYGFSFILLLVPFVFLQLLGFYILGRNIYKSRFFAFLLAILSTMLFNSQSQDYWGVFYDPQPRMMFQAFLPWLLTLAWVSLFRHRLRWLVFIGLGFLIYVHPVSIPAIAFGLWLGFLCYKPADTLWPRHLLNQIILAGIFILCAIPFFIQYMSNREFAAAAHVDYETAVKFLQGIFPFSFQPRVTFSRLIDSLLISGLLPLAYLGAVMVFRFPKQRFFLGLVLTWLAGIVLICFGFSSIELFVESRLRILPIFVDIARGLRYTVPLLEILVLWPLALAWEKANGEAGYPILRRACLAATGLMILLIFSFSFPRTFEYPIPDYRFKSIECFIKGQITCPSPELLDRATIIDAIRTLTPSESRIISVPPVELGGPIRYQALRSEAYDPLDTNRLVLGNVSSAMTLAGGDLEWGQIALLSPAQQLNSYLDFAKSMNADFAVIQNPVPAWLAEKVVYSNATYTLLDLR